ncbi:MAG TPA: AMP-binding protein [Caldilineaceae bacterium]|nr:AMP-binding protein [Caldilineaceae bacterium]
MNLPDLFAIPRQRHPQKIAIQYSSAAGEEIGFSYDELHRAAEQLASGLQEWGLRKGDRVAFFLSNRPEFVIAYLAVIRLGAIMVPINLRYRRLELSHILTDAAPRLLFTERQHLPLFEELLPDDKASLEATVLAEELAQWQRTPEQAAAWPLVASDDLALIMYTSGTTGRSKGAMLSHNNLMATMTGLIAAWAWEQDDRLLLCLPLFHTHGFVVGLHCALAVGATVLLRPGFDCAATIAELTSGAATLFFAVPTIYVRLVEELQKLPKQNFSGLRLFCSGSAPLAAETMTTFAGLTSHTILERYGMTETGMNLSNPYHGPRQPGSVGTPLPGVSMRIVNEQNQDVAPGETGELLVRGSHVFLGYWQAPEKSAASFSHDQQGRQWFHTGDLARQEPESGYVSLLGRRHELIISGGFNIYPREIEEMLVTYPGVNEAAVIGIPDAKWGEVPAAYLVCTGEIDREALLGYCRTQLASFKVPKEIHLVEALPRNAMGKLQKHLLNAPH